MKKINFNRLLRRKRRVSANIKGTSFKPRINVFRSNYYIYAQAIDDEKKATIVSYSSLNLKKEKDFQKNKKTEEAKKIGIKLAMILKKKKITEAVFDRSIYAYQGRVKALAEGIREGGIKI
ncbi:50S ribosomal protein L18 [Candidatus Roizmanbacteria bacterium CG22_combo_CG10-13_8_21_14_all_35_9]|uniref:Large ribosomal subunit protein uL18 n=2 Tax=Candidatus Roizmaniibacteriota TaxID=1752723 RepID=A0A2H0BYB0_9BACT|nr:MAG: 50S ribosomal protein L18 [Candidatus Roizmanbacteria bacterium CG23_combo_of_CG06-09_8_20_14_all_35_49]PIP62657.1 MAG: 50S ribosomal protein L18 [Candidatus Roizmanbacteria bacterium CG22_combo_CG10-13_8_21_14_all_35_9]PJC82608.1 MAG: 50S ribosomal protein L18 [Candidatus Roizmanbacteria bacterium CG_4_8_14_3_um_filter_35_14]